MFLKAKNIGTLSLPLDGSVFDDVDDDIIKIVYLEMQNHEQSEIELRELCYRDTSFYNETGAAQKIRSRLREAENGVRMRDAPNRYSGLFKAVVSMEISSQVSSIFRQMIRKYVRNLSERW
jgi:hypothetical protein